MSIEQYISTLASKLQSLRADGMTDGAISRLVQERTGQKVSFRTIENVRTGKHPPRSSTLELLERALEEFKT